MNRFVALTLLLTACTSVKREYHPPSENGVAGRTTARGHVYSDPHQPPPYRPDPQAEPGEVLSFFYDDSPDSGSAALDFLGVVTLNIITPFGAGVNSSHVPTYRIRLPEQRVVYVRDPGCPPLIRGDRVIVMPQRDGGFKLIPRSRR